MPRKTIGENNDEEKFDFDQLIDPGLTVLKFGRGGSPHERVIRITPNLRFLYWESGWFCRKLGKKCYLDLEKISRVMTGQKTYPFQRWSSKYGYAEAKSLSFIYSNDEGVDTSFDIIVATDDSYDFWYGGLRYLLKRIKEKRSKMTADEKRLEAAWERADTDHSGTLSSKEIIKLIASLNINMPSKVILKNFKLVDSDGSGYLSLDEFVNLMDLLLIRPEILFVWRFVVKGEELSPISVPFALTEKIDPEIKKAVISVDEFVSFWSTYQNDPIDSTELKRLIVVSTGITAKNYDSEINEITYRIFSHIICHEVNDIMDPAKANKYQDMNHPLSHYFIASSHNTYLEGDQLTSASSVNRYINDLLNGCRCVELDCWNGDNNDPIITHGNTLTGKIMFKDVIKAIKQYGFVNSKYPIILSIENHCNLEQQQVLATTIKDTLREMLAYPSDYPDGFLPSPEDLSYKVLLKGKRLSPSVDHELDADFDDALAEEDDEDEDDTTTPSVVEGASNKKKGKVSRQASVTSSASGVSSSTATTAATGKKSKKVEKIKVHQDLSDITFLGTGKNPDIVNGWIIHNRKHLSRIYPKGTRVDSSNYDPASCWAAGSQMVALNYQTNDLPLHVNTGKFRENGNIGYVLKPEYMLSDKGVKSPPIKLTIHVLSGQQLPKPGGAKVGEIIDPFVVLRINGTSEDTSDQRTRTVNDNGFNPIWNEVFTFVINEPDLAILTFDVLDEDVVLSEFVAFYSLPVSCIRQGLRFVPLLDAAGKREQDFAFASLSVRVAIDTL
eukprot:gene20678-26809_t